MNETLLFRSATDTAQALRRKELSSRELTEMLLLRIEAANPALNAVVELRPEAALREAGAADEATARGDDAGPLHGVPMTIKDSFNVAEMHTTWGNPASEVRRRCSLRPTRFVPMPISVRPRARSSKLASIATMKRHQVTHLSAFRGI